MCGGFMAIGIVLCVGLALTDNTDNGRALGTIGAFFLWTSVAYFAPGFIAGLGLLRGLPWARTVLIILSVLILFAIPIGTALGAFGLWVLLGKDSKQLPAQPAPSRPAGQRAAQSISTAEQRRMLGVIVAALGILAAFFVFIGIGYRITNTAGSPISDGMLVVSILVLVASIIAAVWQFRRPSHIRIEPLVSDSHDGAALPPLPEIAKRPEYMALDERIQELARRIDVPANLLPTYGISLGNGLAHIEIEGEQYHYVNAERGVVYSRFTTTALDDLLYIVFRDAAFSMAIKLVRDKRKPDTDYRRTIFPEQVGLLAQLNPEWAERCAAEHVEVLKEHPFVDGRGP